MNRGEGDEARKTVDIKESPDFAHPVSNAFRGHNFFGEADPSPKSSVFGQVVPDSTVLSAGKVALD